MGVLQGYFEDHNPSDCNPATNPSFKERNELAKRDDFELCGRIYADVFGIEDYIPPGVTVKIKLVRSRNEFVLINEESVNKTAKTAAVTAAEESKTTPAAATTPKKYSVKISEAVFTIRRHSILPSLAQANFTALAQGKPMMTTFTKTQVKSFLIPGGSSSVSNDSILSGNLADRFAIIIKKLPA